MLCYDNYNLSGAETSCKYNANLEMVQSKNFFHNFAEYGIGPNKTEIRNYRQ